MSMSISINNIININSNNMNNTFWNNKPLGILNESKINLNKIDNIVNLDILLENINIELERSNVVLYSKNINTINSDNIIPILNFINCYHHKKSSNYKSFESKELLEFKYNSSENVIGMVFFENSNYIEQSLKDIPQSNIVGMIIGKVKAKVINRHESKDFRYTRPICVEHLCINNEHRGNEYAKYIINSFTKEILENYTNLNINCGYFTTNKYISSEYFDRKDQYHRLLKMDTIFNSGIIYKIDNIELFKKVYSCFSYNKKNLETMEVIYNPEYTEELGISIYDNMMEYKIENMDIYENDSFSEIKKVFNNPFFHKFIIKCKDTGNLLGYMCLYNVDLFSLRNNEFYKSGIIWKYFVKEELSITEVIEIVSKHCNDNNIFDLLTFYGVPERGNKLICGYDLTYYYFYNLKIPKINSKKNLL